MISKFDEKNDEDTQTNAMCVVERVVMKSCSICSVAVYFQVKADGVSSIVLSCCSSLGVGNLQTLKSGQKLSKQRFTFQK